VRSSNASPMTLSAVCWLAYRISRSLGWVAVCCWAPRVRLPVNRLVQDLNDLIPRQHRYMRKRRCGAPLATAIGQKYAAASSPVRNKYASAEFYISAGPGAGTIRWPTRAAVQGGSAPADTLH